MTLAAKLADSASNERTTEQAAMSPRRLDLAQVATSAPDLARVLLGTLLVRDQDGSRSVARIVETEAYAGPEDRASHARAGRTARTSVMFGPAGHAYVYLVYGMHHCLNVVCGAVGEAGAVLIRAVEPVEEIESMRQRRGPRGGSDARLGAGPARLCQALAIDRTFDGIDLLRDERLWLETAASGRQRAADVVTGPRIGVEYAGDEWASKPWRFGIAGHPSLSRPFPTAA